MFLRKDTVILNNDKCNGTTEGLAGTQVRIQGALLTEVPDWLDDI